MSFDELDQTILLSPQSSVSTYTMVEAAAKTLQDLAPSNTQRHTSSGMRRPRRPATQKRADNEQREEAQESLRSYMEERERHAHRRKGRRRVGRNTKRQQSLEESFNSLANFAKTNKGRSLNETYSKGLVSSVGHQQADSPADGVHYVNRIEIGTHNTGDGISKIDADACQSTSFQRHEVIEDASGDISKARVAASNAFVVPMEPRGSKLTINILSTWGDPHYVGLMGLEIYDGSGHLVEILNPEKQLWADPADINVLDGYSDDPRTVHNLVDGKHFTCDDLHAWLAPFEPGDDHFIHILFDFKIAISLIRVWNYNKSRIHSYRGARYIEITLDDQFIYRGEVRRATGNTKEGYEACSETLRFTRNSRVLKLVDKYNRKKYSKGAGAIIANTSLTFNDNLNMLTDKQTAMHKKIAETGSSTEINNQSSFACRKQNQQTAPLLDSSPSRPGKPSSRDYLNLIRPRTAGKSDLQQNHSTPQPESHDSQRQNHRRTEQALSKGKHNIVMEDKNNSHFGTNNSINGSISGSKGSSLAKAKKKLIDLKRRQRLAIQHKARSKSIDHDSLTVVSKSIVLRRASDEHARSIITDEVRNNRPRGRSNSMSFAKAVPTKVLDIFIGPNWGDLASVGLCAFRIFRAPTAKENRDASVATEGTPIVLQPSQLTVTALHGKLNKLSQSTISRLVDGRNITTDANLMWTIPKDTHVTWAVKITVTLVTRTDLTGIRIWNYNPNLDESFVGIKWLKIESDGNCLSPAQGYLIRKAPGSALFDYGQTIIFGEDKPVKSPSPRSAASTCHRRLASNGSWVTESVGEAHTGIKTNKIAGNGEREKLIILDEGGIDELLGDDTRGLQNESDDSLFMNVSSFGDEDCSLMGVSHVTQQYLTPLFPTGCMFRFRLLNTCGDIHYIGLNGLEMYDEDDQLIPLTKKNLEASPMRDINALPNNRGDDPRTLQKLADGINNTFDDEHMWLAPYDPQDGNQLFVLFNQPHTISRICIWNYSKTPSRGVSEIEIFVEDSIIYQGMLEEVKVESVETARPVKGGRRYGGGGAASVALDFTQTILFTNDSAIISREIAEGHIYNPQPEENAGGIIFINENERLDAAKASALAEERPNTRAGRQARERAGVQ